MTHVSRLIRPSLPTPVTVILFTTGDPVPGFMSFNLTRSSATASCQSLKAESNLCRLTNALNQSELEFKKKQQVPAWGFIWLSSYLCQARKTMQRVPRAGKDVTRVLESRVTTSKRITGHTREARGRMASI